MSPKTREILERAASDHDISLGEMMSGRRERPMVAARTQATLAFLEERKSVLSIARIFDMTQQGVRKMLKNAKNKQLTTQLSPSLRIQ